VLVFDPSDLDSAPLVVPIVGEDPRAMAVSPDGAEVYVAVFESGNATTILGGGADDPGTLVFPPNVVGDPTGPYGGVNPPPNDGAGFSPPQQPGNPAPPEVGLIVRLDDTGRWMDDNGGDWTDLVSGPQAAASGRKPGWDLADHDVAVIDAATLAVSYERRLMNICMALAVNPQSGAVSVVGTDATNELRYEPNLNGTFVRVEVALFDPANLGSPSVLDLNPHLDYSVSTVPQATRDESIGDPRGIVWNAAGTRAYVAGMGSNNVVVIDAGGQRAGLNPTIEVGEGPTGVALDEGAGRLYVLNKFAATISVVDTATESETAQVGFHDPTPPAIKVGRQHLYDTHAGSGLGQAACASCHVDARMDRLGWDLGDPSGDVEPVAGNNLGANVPGLNTGFDDFHPMKGPMTTQTLQDIIGKEPHHWRGDRTGLEKFNPAFMLLQGDDVMRTPTEMQEFEDFLATIHFPPNPFRNLDNSLPDDLPLPGHYTTGRFGPAGQPLPNGDATRGLQLYRFPNLLDGGALACATCHTMPTGMGTNYRLQGGTYVPIAPGPDGELHHALVSVDGNTQTSIKVPQLRNEYEKTGFNALLNLNTAGFGVLHDGSVDTLERFVSEPAFDPNSDQDIADLVAFLLSFSGSDLPTGAPGTLFEPPGTDSQDAHAAVGQQATLVDAGQASQELLDRIDLFVDLADALEVDLVVKGLVAGEQRGWVHVAFGSFQSDRAGETIALGSLKTLAAPGAELTFTVVPQGSGERVGVDRDGDGYYDRDELDAGSDPADPDSIPGEPGTAYCFGDGSAAPCPCANGVPAETGCANSNGAGAVLSGSGIAHTANDTVELTGAGLIPNQPSLLFQGLNAVAGGDGVGFGDGLRCAGGSVVRIRVLTPDAGGAVSYPGPGDPSVSVAGQVQAGDTRRYQLWYRDPASGPCGTGFNLSNGYEIAWQ
jgi:YVTN family beta-propeller protein